MGLDLLPAVGFVALALVGLVGYSCVAFYVAGLLCRPGRCDPATDVEHIIGGVFWPLGLLAVALYAMSERHFFDRVTRFFGRCYDAGKAPRPKTKLPKATATTKE